MKHSPTGRCRRRPRDGTRSSPRMPDSMRSGGITRGSACPSARSRTMPAPSSAISPRFRKRWRPSPIVSAIGCPPSGGGSTSGWSMPRLSARYRSHRDMTIIHGDAHVWNALVSRDDLHADVAGEPRPRRMDLVEPSGMHHGRRARSRLSRTALTGAQASRRSRRTMPSAYGAPSSSCVSMRSSSGMPARRAAFTQRSRVSPST